MDKIGVKNSSPDVGGVFSSMTGFGTASADVSGYRVIVETRSVNSRHLDINIKSGFTSPALDSAITALVNSKLSRGRVDISVQVSRGNLSGASLRINEEKFLSGLSAFRHGARLAGLAEETVPLAQFVTELLSRRDIFDNEEANELTAELAAGILELAGQAIDNLLTMRKREGQLLRTALVEYAASLKDYRERLTPLVAQSLDTISLRLKTRLENLDGVEVDSQRYAQEIVYFTDRLDVSEEIVRLGSHLAQLEGCFVTGGGRKMEFILQEMGREINTIGSKSQSAEISNIVVECKAILEKLREQVMNIE
ncbi:MAG: YicC family protein [bacterium]|nr:YicC family protein [bacterium]